MDVAIWIVVVLLIVIAIVLLYNVYKRRTARESKQTQAPRRPADPFAPTQDTTGDPRHIKAGDLLEFGDEKFFVRGSVHLSEGGSTWSEHFFQSDTSAVRQWLSVEEDPDIEIAIWRDRPDLDILPNVKSFDIDDVHYELTEHGTASYRSEGTTGLRATGGMDYADFESADGKMLSFERYDHGKWEASTGESVPTGSFTIYPGS